MLRRRLSLLTVALIIVAGLWFRFHSENHVPPSSQSALPLPEGRHKSYSTSFSVTENPLSENGKWIDGRVAGLDWTSVAVAGGLASGTESGRGQGDQAYDDSTALLAGTWGPDQTVEAEVYSVRQNAAVLEEVELRLRSSLSSHRSTGYEILFRCLKTPQAYASIARWDGSVGRFTYLTQKYGLQYGVGTGDLVKASIVGNVITGYINGVELLKATDSAFSNGSPGIGFWMQRHSGLRAWFSSGRTSNKDYGFTRLAAWD